MTPARLEVLFTPAEFEALRPETLVSTVCIVVDVLRATSSVITALAHGAAGILPAADLAEALAVKHRHPEALLAGERDGLRIPSTRTGGVEFDFGNSPREFATPRVAGRWIIMTTTNGTRALRSTGGARAVFAGAFLNATATAQAVRALCPERVLIICSGTYAEASLEDALAAGAFCDLLWDVVPGDAVADSAQIVRALHQHLGHDPVAAATLARNGRRLLEHPDLGPDVPFALRRDVYPRVARLTSEGIQCAKSAESCSQTPPAAP